MHTRRPLLILAATVSLGAGLMACGSDAKTSTTGPATTEQTTETTVTTDTTPSTDDTTPSTELIEYSSDPETALIRAGSADSMPGLVLGGDGWLYQPSGEPVGAPPEASATTPAGFVRTGADRPVAVPAPPAPTPFERRRLTPEGVQIVLAFAADKGLLQHQEYEAPGVTDMGSSVLTVSVGSGTYEHVAYALSYEHQSGNRADLFEFYEGLSDLDALVGSDNIGPAEAYVPDTFLVTIDGSYYTDGQQIDWPSDVPVEEGCIQLPIDRFAPGVAGLYLADIDGETTRVAVVPDLPGDDCT